MKTRLLLSLCPGAALVVVLGLPTDANAAAIHVNDLTDAVSNDGRCTLREAITAAETDTASGSAGGECGAGSGADVIFLPAGRIHLTGSTALNVSTTIFVLGGGPTTSVIDAGGMSDTAIRVGSSGFLELQSLGFENAWVDPAFARGGIHVGGFFVARGSRFAHNFGFVGVLDVILGRAVILNSVFEHNACDVSPWSAWGVDWGGTIGASNGAEVDVQSSTFSDNFCDSHGGALNGTSGAVLTVEDTVFTRNDVTLGGGAISITDGSSLRLTRSQIDDSTADAGGAIYADGAEQLWITASRIDGGTAATAGGGVLIDSTFSIIEDSSITHCDSAVGGAIYGRDFGGTTPVYIDVSTLSANTASVGQAIYANTGAWFPMRHVTIDDHAAGSLITSGSGKVELYSSILDGTTGPHVSGLVDSNGYNVVPPGTTLGGWKSTDHNAHAALDPLALDPNGTYYHPIPASSPATGVGWVSFGDYDQIGTPRFAGVCDAGAIESPG